MAHDRALSALEASFLNLEAPETPMHVAGVTIFDGTPRVTLDDLRVLLHSRLHRLPKFRQRVSTNLLGVTRERWTPGRVNLDEHLFHHRLRAPGRMSDMFALCGRIHETPLDRGRPLWEVHLIDGLDGHDQALLVKTHHAITDGLAGIEVAEVLFDPVDGGPRPSVPETRFATVKAMPGLSAVQSVLGLAFMAAGGPLALPGPFNGPVGMHRTFGATTLSMDAVTRAKRRLGGSVDDVIVATVAAGLYRYLVDVRYAEIPHALRAMLPVSTRGAERAIRLGNRVSSIFVDLPMHTADPAEVLPAIAHAKATLRLAHAAAGGSLLVEAAALLPAPLHRPAMRIVSALPFAHVVLSDVPGPELPLQVLGHRIKACYPLMPLTANIGLSIAAISLGGAVGIGVTADPGLVPDPQRVATAIGRAFATLEPRGVAHAGPRPHRPATRKAA